MLIPKLETERLVLRGHTLSDFPALAAMWSDTIVTHYFGGKPFTEEDCWTRLLRYAGHWEMMGFGYWAVEEKATGTFVGDVGLADYKRDIQPSLQGIPEIGWVLASQTHGKGYATEAARAAIAWGSSHFGPVRTVCIIHPDNTPSIRVAEKCGYREMQLTTYKGHPAKLFERPAESESLV